MDGVHDHHDYIIFDHEAYLSDSVVGNLVRVLADLVDDSLHRLCGPAEDVTCDRDDRVTSGTLITLVTSFSPISCSL